uniref:SP-RING-type domain-containing protein n=1 Tax=Glossina pallidipes TaxID=7398 RepID=A0A1A9ZGR8_GLOPL
MASKMTNLGKNRSRISPYPDHQSPAFRGSADSLYAQLKEFRVPSKTKFLYPSIHAYSERSSMQNIAEEECNVPSDEILSCKTIECGCQENIPYGDSSAKFERNISREEYNIQSDEVLSCKTTEFDCSENILYGDLSALCPTKIGSGSDIKSDYVMHTNGMYCGAYTIMLPNEPIESYIDHQTQTSSMDINLQNAFHQEVCSTENTAWSDITDGSSSDNGASNILSRSSDSVCSDSVLQADSEHHAAGPVLCVKPDESYANAQINAPSMDANLQNVSQQQFGSMGNNVTFPIENNANLRTDSTNKHVSSENIPCEDSVAADENNTKPSSDIIYPGSTVSTASPTAQRRLYEDHSNVQTSLASTNANWQCVLTQAYDVLYMPPPVETAYVHADIGVSGDVCGFKNIPQEGPGRYFDSSSHFSQQSISNLDLQGTINIVGGKLPGRMEEAPLNTSAVYENPRPHSGNPMHLLIPNPSEQIRQTNASVKEMTFTMPMDEGRSAILKRIDISRQLHSSRRIFHLSPGQYKMLMSRSDLEIQLKCLRVDRNKIGIAWPQSVSICVNDKPLGNEYLERAQRDKASFYFKLLCHLGDNTLKFKFSPNTFGVYDQNLINEIPNACIGDRSNTIQGKRIKVSFICRLLGSKMQTPARGVTCKHLQCFDLATYLRTNYKDEMWRCPECDEYAPIERLEIDEFYRFLLTKLKTSNVKEVIIDSSVNWWPVFDDKMDNNNKGGNDLFIPNCNNILIASDSNIDNAKCVHKEG